MDSSTGLVCKWFYSDGSLQYVTVWQRTTLGNTANCFWSFDGYNPLGQIVVHHDLTTGLTTDPDSGDSFATLNSNSKEWYPDGTLALEDHRSATTTWKIVGSLRESGLRRWRVPVRYTDSRQRKEYSPDGQVRNDFNGGLQVGWTHQIILVLPTLTYILQLDPLYAQVHGNYTAWSEAGVPLLDEQYFLDINWDLTTHLLTSISGTWHRLAPPSEETANISGGPPLTGCLEIYTNGVLTTTNCRAQYVLAYFKILRDYFVQRIQGMPASQMMGQPACPADLYTVVPFPSILLGMPEPPIVLPPL